MKTTLCTALLPLALVAALAGCPAGPENDSSPDGGSSPDAAVKATDGNIDDLTKSGVTLVDFWATWCPPCRQQGPIVDRVAEAYKGKATVAKLDVDENKKTASRFGVQAIPTLIIFKDGKPVETMVGLQSESDLKQKLDAHLGR
jgi:thioredoxin 1